VACCTGALTRGCEGRNQTKVGLEGSWQESSSRKVQAGQRREASVQKGRLLRGVSLL